MNRRNIVSLSVLTFVGAALLHGSAVAQQKSFKDLFVGNWTLVSAITTNADGSKFFPFGEKPSGALINEENGHFVSLNINALPKIASGNRLTATADENKAIVQGVLGQIGTWSIDDASKTFVQHVNSATFANWDGTDQKKIIDKLTEDELVYENPAPTTGAGSTILSYRREK